MKRNYRRTIGMMLLLGALVTAALLVGCPNEGRDVAVAPEAIDSPPAEVTESIELPEMEPTPAPDFTLEAPGGTQVSLEDFRGKILVLDFWATWCSGCIKEMPKYQELYQSWDHDRVAYLGVSLDSSIEVVEAFLERRDDLSLPMALGDEAMLDAYLGERRTIPAARIIDADGMLRYKFGPGPSADKVRVAVERLLAEAESAGE